MNLGSLFSGGKDSTYAIHMAQKQEHKVSELVIFILFNCLGEKMKKSV